MTTEIALSSPRAIIAHVDLTDGQNQHGSIPSTKGSGWYNQHGERVGRGGLTRMQMIEIAKGMREGERLIVLHEEDSFRRFLRSSLPDWIYKQRDEDAPGLPHIASHALFIIERNTILRVEKVQPIREAEMVGDVRFKLISPEDAEARVLGKEVATH